MPANEKWIVDFTKPEKSPFEIKSDSSFNAYLSNGSLALDLKKPNCIAWVETPDYEYQDHIIEAIIRLDNTGGYAAAGIMFRIAHEESYYMALVSNKGYFRLDAVKNNSPKPLIAWTEVSDFDGSSIKLKIITYGTYMIFIINGKWAGEISDNTISSGGLGFALASYEPASAADNDAYICKSLLEYFSIDTRVKSIEENYRTWNDDDNINADARLRLAETFAVMGNSVQALEQINMAWRRREKVFQSVSAAYTDARTRKELLLAARMAFRLGQYREADEFIDAIFEYETVSAETGEAVIEKARILGELKKYAELKEFILKHINRIKMDVDMYNLLARSHWELNEYKDAADAWNNAFKLASNIASDGAAASASAEAAAGTTASTSAGVYAANAANALELAGEKDKALELFLAAGKIFLRLDNSSELLALVPKLAMLGEKNIEARTLIGKWAFSIEDYKRCEAEFTAAEKIRRGMKPRPKQDAALCYLWGICLGFKDKYKEAIGLLEKAVKLAPGYGLFRFKLAEFKLKNGQDPAKPQVDLVKEFRLALEQMEDTDGTMARNAGTLLLNAGHADDAAWFFGKAGEKQD